MDIVKKYLTHQLNNLFLVILPVSPLLFCCSTFFLTSCSFSHLRTRASHKKGGDNQPLPCTIFATKCCHIKLGLLLNWPHVGLVMIYEKGGHNSQFWTQVAQGHTTSFIRQQPSNMHISISSESCIWWRCDWYNGLDVGCNCNMYLWYSLRQATSCWNITW